jgi:gas vesicle protein
MSSDTDEPRPFGFINGLLTGVVVGAALAMWFAPPAVSDLRKRVIDSARSLGKRVGQQREQARSMVGETAEELAQRGHRVRDNIVDAVAHRAHEVEAYVTAAGKDRVAAARTRSSGEPPAATSRLPLVVR